MTSAADFGAWQERVVHRRVEEKAETQAARGGACGIF